MANPIYTEFRGRVAVITINRPEKLGALTRDGFYSLSQQLREVDRHDEVFVTVLTGKGRFFSAGADVSVSRKAPPGTDLWRHGWNENAPHMINMTHAFYSHSKILVTALNGPVVGLAATLVAFSDFIYCVPYSYLLTPFSSLGLIAEGGSSLAFVRRMGVAKANEALLASKRLTSEELLACGFVNKVFDCAKGEEQKFVQLVLDHIDDTMGAHLVGSSMTNSKALITAPLRQEIDKQLVAEVVGGIERFAKGIPQAEFEKMRTGVKRHKL